MPDWFGGVIDTSSSVQLSSLAPRLLLALGFGFVINFIYNGTRHRDGYAGTFPTTLVLVCVLISMVTQVIGDNVARAFSLVGALSIVRFRTVVRDTKDTAFVIFAVVVGMATGAGQPLVAICGIFIVGLAAVLLSDRNQSLQAPLSDLLLTVRMNWTASLEDTILELVGRHVSELEQVSVETARQGTCVDLTYRVRFLPHTRATEFVAELNRIEGIQSVELQSQKQT